MDLPSPVPRQPAAAATRGKKRAAASKADDSKVDNAKVDNAEAIRILKRQCREQAKEIERMQAVLLENQRLLMGGVTAPTLMPPPGAVVKQHARRPRRRGGLGTAGAASAPRSHAAVARV